MITFKDFNEAIRWAMINGRDNCLPCHKWSIEQVDKNEFAVAVHYRASNDFVGYVPE